MQRRYWLILCCGAAIVMACSKKWAEPPKKAFEGFSRPANFPEATYRFANNAITEAKFELGRKLFYDPRFSRNNTISCGSCHIQSAGFTHHGHDVSHGIEDRLGTRNSQAIMNIAWGKSFFWDGGVTNLDLQPIVPINNPVEMDETIENVIKKLREQPQYPGLFKKAFGSEEIDTERIMKALSQFMVMLVSANSKYDKVMRNENNEQFTEAEARGYALFKTNCASCHKEPLFTDESYRDNGIGAGPNNDPGRFGVTQNEADRLKFKVPSLRNTLYTAPYMHDGRFLTLDAILEHYAENVRNTPNLDPALKQDGQPGLPLTAENRADLLAFLKTLNDQQFVTDPRFAETY
ncbi:cytochrome-c peroxidase [Chitinophaga rhizosphaerae]|uniref:cytochrome-c peroxidase n=1 Tax=Chitinophaga rhizosphaerae TaxID=1864947 RepID=UPI000F81545C|nr:cytochrome c peroxidase [Chitinophaga rhizosphaerae]